MYPIVKRTKTSLGKKIPDGCLGFLLYYCPVCGKKGTSVEWVKEEIIGYTYDSFLHQAKNCPMYKTKFSEFGKTVRKVK